MLYSTTRKPEKYFYKPGKMTEKALTQRRRNAIVKGKEGFK
jgi:hypothetical protein